MIKGSIDNEEISVLNMYAPNGIASKFLKEKLAELEEEINSNTILVGDSVKGGGRGARGERRNMNNVTTGVGAF